MLKRNVIETSTRREYSKQELIDEINRLFPDEEVGIHGSIATMTTTKMTDGTVSQSFMFGKLLDNDFMK